MNCAKCEQEIQAGDPTKRGMHKNCYQKLFKRGSHKQASLVKRTDGKEILRHIAEYARLAEENPDLNRRELSDKVGVPLQKITDWHRKRRIPMPGKKIHGSDYERIADQYWRIRDQHPALTKVEISRMLGISTQKLYLVLKRCGEEEGYEW